MCEAAAAAPWALRPAFTISTGLLRAAARAADMNLRAPSTDSAYISTERVRGQVASQSSMSPKSTSACSPSETKCEKPMPRPRAQSSIAVTSAPDCETKARLPGSAPVWAKLAFSPRCGTSSPRQLGPRMRSRCGRAAFSIDVFVAASKPALSTTAARVPRAPSSATRAGTVAGGVQITASSGATGRLRTSGWQGSPSSVAWRGFTAQRGPRKRPSRTLRQTVAPTLPGRAEAPMTAIEAGSKKWSRWRMLMRGSGGMPGPGPCARGDPEWVRKRDDASAG